MNNQNLVLVSFNRDQLQMVEHEGQPFVVMKPLVKALKMKWEKHKPNYYSAIFKYSCNEFSTVSATNT